MRSFAPLVFAFALVSPMAAPQAALAAPAGKITVTGEASVTAAPDLARVSLGVTTTGTTAAEALNANSAALKAVMQRLTAEGISGRDIQTSGLSLGPEYARRVANEPPQITGYTASNVVDITVRQIDKTGAVLDAAVRDGANRLNGLSFGLADPKPQEAEARKAAVADARAKADTLATAAGVHLGQILSIRQPAAAPMPVPRYGLAEAAMPVPVSRGTLTVTQSVTIVWSLVQ